MSQPSNMATQAATGSTTWAKCAKIKAVDGKIIAVTEHDEALDIDLGDGDGTQTYTPEDGVELSTGRLSADLSVDNVDVVGIIDTDRLTHEDLHRGRYDNGEITIFEVDWQNPGSGQWIHFAGPMGKLETHGDEYTVELLSWMAGLRRVISSTITEQCRKSFGSLTRAQERKPNAPCGVDLNPSEWQASTAYAATHDKDRTVGDRVKPTTHNGYWFRCIEAGTSDAAEPTWPTTVGATIVDGTVTWEAERALSFPGTVTAVTNERKFTASGISVETDYFSMGHIEWLTGDNVGRGQNSPVATDDGAGGIVIYRPVLKPIQIGDTFTIFAGCNKSHARCVELKNQWNNNGVLYVPPRTVN